MLKDRFYYKDAYCKEFVSQLVHESKDSNGTYFAVLENTSFYPSGGGQPSDIGTLNGVAVHNVEEVEGEIRHFLEKSLGSADKVEGMINWEHRFDHMQQHAGQHILSAAFVELFNFPTVSFHLGKEIVSIDIDAQNVTAEQLETVERLANQVILENRSIETKWITEVELDQYDLRKQVAVSGDIRLVIIPDFDDNGCGGTHPASTGEVRALKILSTEKHKQKTRVYFVCGDRILDQLHWKNRELADASKRLSVPEYEVSLAAQKLLDTNHSLEKALNEAREQLLIFEAKELTNSQQQPIIKATYENRTVQELQKLARLLIADSEHTIALLVAQNEDRLQFVAARGEAVETSMKQISSAALSLINGKGGGNDSFVQGGGEQKVHAEELLQAMHDAVTL